MPMSCTRASATSSRPRNISAVSTRWWWSNASPTASNVCAGYFPRRKSAGSWGSMWCRPRSRRPSPRWRRRVCRDAECRRLGEGRRNYAAPWFKSRKRMLSQDCVEPVLQQHAPPVQIAEIAVRHWLELLFQSIDLLVGVVVFAEQLGEVGVIVLEPVNFGVIFRKILIDNMTNAIHIQDPPVIVVDEEPNGMTACRGPRRLSLTQSRSQPYMDADPSQPRDVEGKLFCFCVCFFG